MSGGLRSIDNTFSLGTDLSILCNPEGEMNNPPRSLQRHHTVSQKQLHFPQSRSVPDICERAFNPLNHQLVTLFFVMFHCSGQKVLL